MKILIIGSKGFIGTHCLQYFMQNHQVWECDVAVDYGNENYFQVDPTHADYRQCFENHKYDICINCSGAASVPQSVENPLRDFELNVSNVFKQLEGIRKFNPHCSYLNLSSAAVYGNPETLPVKETQNLQPISPYGHHKLMAEGICEEFYKLFDINTCSLRIFSAYGPGLYKQLFWDVFKKMQGARSIELYGTGNESRDFIYVTDVVKAIDQVIKKNTFVGQAINVGSGKETTIREAVTLFKKHNQFDGEIIFGGQHREGDPIHWVADVDKLSALDFVTTVSLDKGLKAYAQWAKELG